MVSATSFLPNFFTQSCLRLLHLYSRKEYVSLWIVILNPFVNLFKWIAYGCTSSVESFIYFSLTVKSALLVKLHCWFYNLLLIRSFTAGSCASILSRWSFQTQLLSGFYWMYFFVFSLTVWPLLPQFPFCPLRSFRSTLFHCRKKIVWLRSLQMSSGEFRQAIIWFSVQTILPGHLNYIQGSRSRAGMFRS